MTTRRGTLRLAIIALPLAVACRTEQVASEPSAKRPSTPAQDDEVVRNLLQEVRGDVAFGEFASPLPVADAERLLMMTRCFVTDEIPYGMAAPFRQVQAFNVIMDSSDARDIIHRLIRDGGPVARLYGLCGSALVAPEGHVAALAQCEADKTKIVVLDGCVERIMSVSAVARLVVQRDLPNRLRDVRDVCYDAYGQGAG
jgi:hypothetical protein